MQTIHSLSLFNLPGQKCQKHRLATLTIITKSKTKTGIQGELIHIINTPIRGLYNIFSDSTKIPLNEGKVLTIANQSARCCRLIF